MAKQDAEDRRLVRLLEDRVHDSRRSVRDLERALGVSHGYLGHLFGGRMKLRLEHVRMLGRELGFDAAAFFRDAYGPADPSRPIAGRRESGRGDLLDAAGAGYGEAPQPRRLNREEIESLVRQVLKEELDRLGLAGSGEASGSEED